MNRICVVTLALTVFAGTALADWDLRDYHKMHYPQLPDIDGWDINGTSPLVLADDWQCSESGPVTDVHIWGSWRHDDIGKIRKIHLSIHENVTGDYSHPGALLWERDFGPDEFSIRDAGNGDQGWYTPGGDPISMDHKQCHQINIVGIEKPWVQERGTIYWLDVSVELEPIDPGTEINERWGWKTSGVKQFMDTAVWRDAAGAAWNPLLDPETGARIDLAFVITPEPTSMALLGLGGLCVLRRRRGR